MEFVTITKEKTIMKSSPGVLHKHFFILALIRNSSLAGEIAKFSTLYVASRFSTKKSEATKDSFLVCRGVIQRNRSPPCSKRILRNAGTTLLFEEDTDQVT